MMAIAPAAIGGCMEPSNTLSIRPKGSNPVTTKTKPALMAIQRNNTGQVYSPVPGKWLFETPEERVCRSGGPN